MLAKTINANKWYILAGLALLVAFGAQLKALFGYAKSTPKIGRVDVENPKPTDGATITDEKAKVLSSRLYNAMHYTFGTNEEEIFDILGTISLPNFWKVYNAFGMINYSTFFGEQSVPVLTNKYDLLEWLAFELNDKEIDQLKKQNQIFQNLL